MPFPPRRRPPPKNPIGTLNLGEIKVTFYLAGSSDRIATMEERIAELTRRGYHCLFDWTKEVRAFGPGGEQQSREWKAAAVESDINAARCAHYFIACIAAPPSRGTYMELGARLGVKGKAHVILEDVSQMHLFFNHPLIKLWASWELFIEWLEGPGAK